MHFNTRFIILLTSLFGHLAPRPPWAAQMPASCSLLSPEVLEGIALLALQSLTGPSEQLVGLQSGLAEEKRVRPLCPRRVGGRGLPDHADVPPAPVLLASLQRTCPRRLSSQPRDTHSLPPLLCRLLSPLRPVWLPKRLWPERTKAQGPPGPTLKLAFMSKEKPPPGSQERRIR